MSRKPSPQDLWNRILTEPPHDLPSRQARYAAALTEHGYLAALDDLARIAPPTPHRATPEHVCYRCAPETTPARTTSSDTP